MDQKIKDIQVTVGATTTRLPTDIINEIDTNYVRAIVVPDNPITATVDITADPADGVEFGKDVQIELESRTELKNFSAVKVSGQDVTLRVTLYSKPDARESYTVSNS
tara:strand:+ start:499 stop:819 length:321 start_codon:yes stop_codon:yes gene_type:complete